MRIGWIVFVSLFVLANGAQAVELPSSTVPNSVGVNIHFDGSSSDYLQQLDMLQAAGVGVVRADFIWQRIEATKGTYDFTALDQLATACTARNIRIFGVLGYGNSNYSSDFTSDSFRNGFTAFATAAASHFSGRNFTWEAWNEPNNPIFWPSTDPNQYMALANQVLPAIHAADSTATVIAPACGPLLETGWNGYQAYMTACFNYGTNNPGKKGLLDANMANAVSVHLYRGECPETAIAQYATIRSWMPSGSTASIVSGEWGYSVGNWDYKDTSGNTITMTPKLQGDYLQRMNLANLKAGIPLSVWYDWKNDGTRADNYEENFGLVENNLTPKPAYYAMQTLTSNLAGKTYSSTISDGNSADYILAFTNAAGRKTYAAWTTESPGIRTISGLGANCKYYLSGTPMYLGEVQQWQSGSTWSSATWSNTTGGGNGSWVAGSQAKFTSSATVNVNTPVSFSGLQFLNSSGNVTLNSSGSGTLLLSSGGGAIHTNTRAVTINASITGGGNSTNTCQLAKTGTSTLTLGGNNTFVGNFIVAQGVAKANNANALAGPMVTLNNNNCLTFGTGIGTFNVGGISGTGNLALADTGGSAITLQVGGGNSYASYSGILSGAGSLVKKGTSDWLLAGANTYTGSTTINSGSIVMNNNQAFGNTSSMITLAGGAIALNGYNLSGHSVTIASNQSSLSNWNAGSTSVFAPTSIAINSDFVVCGTGNIELSGNFSCSQKRTITKGSSGVLTLSGTADNSTLALYARGGTVQLNKASNNSPGVHAVACIDGIDAGAVVQYTGTGDYQVWQGGTINLNGGTLDFNGHHQRGTSLAITAAGSTIANSSSTPDFYQPTSIAVAPIDYFTVNTGSLLDLQAGIVCDVSGGVWPHLKKTGAGELVLGGGDATNVLLTVDAIQGTVSLNKGTADGVHAAYCASASSGGTIRYLAGGDHQIQQSGWVHLDGGTIDFNGHNQTGTDLTVLTEGSTLANTAASTTSTYAANSITVNSNFTVNTIGNLNINSNITGTAGLTKTGSGTLYLHNSVSYSGTTNVNAGTLVISQTGSLTGTAGTIVLNGGTLQHNSATSLSRSIVFNGGTLAGTGTYLGNLSVGNGHLSPGDGGGGSLTIVGNVTMADTSALDIFVGATAGSCSSLVFGQSGGNLILDGILNISNATDIVFGTYTIIVGATNITDNGLSFGVVPTSHHWSYAIESIGGKYNLVVTAAPEPNASVLIAIAALNIACFCSIRRRRG